jgi:cell division protein FtsZ
VAHPDANIIFGAVIDDSMGDEVRVTVIAAGFERWEEGSAPTSKAEDLASTIFSAPEPVDIFADATGADEQLDLGDDDFDVPSFLR